MVKEDYNDGEKEGEWVENNGIFVRRFYFPSTLYRDETAVNLTNKYDLRTISLESVLSSLGKSQVEEVACKILGLSRLAGFIVGCEKSELQKYVSGLGAEPEYILNLKKGEYLRSEMFCRKSLLFPTEKLLINQKVKIRTTI